MSIILDNPIWNALTTGSKIHAEGNDCVRFMQRDKGQFVGFRTYRDEEWQDLEEWFSVGDPIILFTPGDVAIPSTWKVMFQRPISQMVFDGKVLPEALDSPRAVPLTEANVPEMISLTRLTNPGPFFSKTIELGRYEGIFQDGRLAAMSGQRLNPSPFVEVSAVCTHPDFLGKGFGAELIRNQIQYILEEGKTPFLHVYPDNYGAIRLYERMGFKLRREMRVYFLEKA
ncbi:GNAT family N-acetyltransferase [Algoriphagus aestuariicola]|uniref:GNAT family N-acetyltransferase n=1 Tax=Algoriphagus aestuariicola TaxID=1852016 RepID=A0ABS3BP55_9BACT|nr:GNAT family N-acetyltransferase [Algoriphagus aestuariicola]MBN7800812.1 GNAT family N-acetyltransferase [Algoriphagus aestuariicola]